MNPKPTLSLVLILPLLILMQTDRLSSNTSDETNDLLRAATPPGMVFIPGGTFTMGDEWGDGFDDERPTHEVTVSSFWMDETEVTTAAFEAYMRRYSPDSSWYEDKDDYSKCNIGSGRDDHPVNCVTWYAANDYCTKMGKRLPSEAEWEYAAGNGAQHTQWSLGDTFDSDVYCFDEDQTCPVKSYAANDFGLYDMSGNVWEWCEDWYDDDFYDQRIQWINPVNNTEAAYRVLRGGSWNSANDRNLRVVVRFRFTPVNWNSDEGFRCVAP